MIKYKCDCGSELMILANSENSRKAKREWKAKHSKKNDGHHWARLLVKKIK